jgi:hypothetical protein
MQINNNNMALINILTQRIWHVYRGDSGLQVEILSLNETKKGQSQLAARS